MIDIKKHYPYIAASVLLAFSTAYTLAGILELALMPEEKHNAAPVRLTASAEPVRTADIQFITNAGFFTVANTDEKGAAPQAESVSNLTLLGTITGPSSIARAMIKKNADNKIEIYRIGSDISGLRLVRIDNTKVYLKSGESVQTLDMYGPKDTGGGAPQQNTATPQGGNIKQTISRAEIMQKIQNNMDNMIKGMRAGPYREDGVIQGYKIFALTNESPLYEMGIRGGDVIKRINGHPIDSTEKLYNLWQQLPKENRFLIDLQRGGGTVTIDFNITN